VNPLPAEPIITGPVNLAGGMLTASYTSTNTSGLSHIWSINNGVIQSGQGTNSITVLWGNTGPYSVHLVVEDNNICKNTRTVYVTKGVGVNSFHPPLENIIIYPNPVNSTVRISFNSEGIKMIEICNEIGQVIIRSTSPKEITLDMNTYPKGIYFIKVSDENGSVVKRIVKL
jgi:hypothetical protein